MDRAQRWRCARACCRTLFGSALAVGRLARRFLPRELADHIPSRTAAGHWPEPRHARKMLVMEGCVQPALKPNIDAAMARVLDRIGISPLRVPAGGCCGALSHHLAAEDEARDIVRRNIDAWWPHVQRGLEAIVVTASGCGVMVKDYGHFLAARRHVCRQGSEDRGDRARSRSRSWLPSGRRSRR